MKHQLLRVNFNCTSRARICVSDIIESWSWYVTSEEDANTYLTMSDEALWTIFMEGIRDADEYWPDVNAYENITCSNTDKIKILNEIRYWMNKAKADLET